MKNCELCNSVAKLYCESDQANLCWDCDFKVHSANFLVTKHTRILLCHLCQSFTPWTGSGTKLSPTVSACQICVNNQIIRNEDDDDDDGYTDDGDDTDEEDEDESVGEEDEENQVVPLSSSSTLPPPANSGSSGSEERSCNSHIHETSRPSSQLVNHQCSKSAYADTNVRALGDNKIRVTNSRNDEIPKGKKKVSS